MGRQMMKEWTFFEKEEQVKDMESPQKRKNRSKTLNPSQTKGEQVDNMDPPRKGGVMMRLTSMMDDSDDGLTFVCGRQHPLFRMAGITLYS